MSGENASMRLQMQNRQLDVKISLHILRDSKQMEHHRAKWFQEDSNLHMYVVHTDLIWPASMNSNCFNTKFKNA